MRNFASPENYEKQLILRNIDQQLADAYKSSHYNNENIEETFLPMEDINSAAGSWEENLSTGQPIKWFSRYGVELVDVENRIFTIHFRSKPPKYAKSKN